MHATNWRENTGSRRDLVYGHPRRLQQPTPAGAGRQAGRAAPISAPIAPLNLTGAPCNGSYLWSLTSQGRQRPFCVCWDGGGGSCGSHPNRRCTGCSERPLPATLLQQHIPMSGTAGTSRRSRARSMDCACCYGLGSKGVKFVALLEVNVKQQTCPSASAVALYQCSDALQ